MEGGVSFFTSSNAGEVIESFLFENLGFRYKKTASRKRGGAEFLDQNDLVSDLRERFPLPVFSAQAA